MGRKQRTTRPDSSRLFGWAGVAAGLPSQNQPNRTAGSLRSPPLPSPHHHSDAAPPMARRSSSLRTVVASKACARAAPGAARHSCGSPTSSRSRLRRRRPRSPARGTRPPLRRRGAPQRRRYAPGRLARFALHLLWSSPLPPLPTLPFDQPRDRLSAAARVFVAVSAVSSMATAAGWGAGRNRLLQPSHFQPAEQDLQFFIKSKSPPFRLGNSFCDDKVQEVFPFTQPFQVPISLLLRSPADRGNNAH